MKNCSVSTTSSTDLDLIDMYTTIYSVPRLQINQKCGMLT